MTVARGYKAATVIDFESVYNTTPSAKKGFKLPINKNELENKQTLIDSETITGTRNTVQSSLGRKSVDGNITIPADYRAIGAWLKALFGNPVNAGTAAPYTHKYKIGDTHVFLGGKSVSGYWQIHCIQRLQNKHRPVLLW